MRVVFVAGDSRQAKMAAQRARLGPQDWHYASSPRSIMGLRGYVLVVIGGALQRPDYREIIEIARASDALITIEEDAWIRIRAMGR